jgi:endonuclease VIII
VPEGDTIYRTARTLQQWLGGRNITAAQTTMPNVSIRAVVGRTVLSVEPVGKNVLMHFAAIDEEPELILHTHMRMTGSWHVYSADAPWQKPFRQARVVLRADDRIAVCFNAPVIELSTAAATMRRRSINRLGPDVLTLPLDLAGITMRADSMRTDIALGELLLDQSVVCGIGNIYRCEALFHERLHPWTPRSTLNEQQFHDLITVAARFMHVNLTPGAEAVGREFGDGRGQTWVYRRAGLPCRVCGTSIVSKSQGDQARTAYWCPQCQVLGAYVAR